MHTYYRTKLRFQTLLFILKKNSLGFLHDIFKVLSKSKIVQIITTEELTPK